MKIRKSYKKSKRKREVKLRGKEENTVFGNEESEGT